MVHHGLGNSGPTSLTRPLRGKEIPVQYPGIHRASNHLNRDRLLTKLEDRNIRSPTERFVQQRHLARVSGDLPEKTALISPSQQLIKQDGSAKVQVIA